MLWVIMAVVEVICAIVAVIYYNVLIRRLLSLLFPKWKLRLPVKILLWVISFALGALSSNLFTTTGVVMVHIMAAALVMELINFIIKKKTKGAPHKYWDMIFKSLLVPLLITAVIFAYGYYNIRDVRETFYTVQTEKSLPDTGSENGFRILLITDSHYGTIFEGDTLRELKSRMDALEPDLVVLGGDIVDESTTKEQMKEIFSEFGKLESTYGVYYVYGNHDRQTYTDSPYFTPQELEDTIVESGIAVLKDECVKVTEGVEIAGREDYSGMRGRKSVSEILAGADPSDYIIMADHQPVEYAENEAAQVDLILSGHTHAGQLFPSGYVMKWFHTSDLYYGHEKFGDMDAVVSAGVAGWGYPIRTQKHSEYTIIDVKNV